MGGNISIRFVLLKHAKHILDHMSRRHWFKYFDIFTNIFYDFGILKWCEVFFIRYWKNRLLTRLVHLIQFNANIFFLSMVLFMISFLCFQVSLIQVQLNTYEVSLYFIKTFSKYNKNYHTCTNPIKQWKKRKLHIYLVILRITFIEK